VPRRIIAWLADRLGRGSAWRADHVGGIISRLADRARRIIPRLVDRPGGISLCLAAGAPPCALGAVALAVGGCALGGAV
jgi:hypothetical protein